MSGSRSDRRQTLKKGGDTSERWVNRGGGRAGEHREMGLAGPLGHSSPRAQAGNFSFLLVGESFHFPFAHLQNGV